MSNVYIFKLWLSVFLCPPQPCGIPSWHQCAPAVCLPGGRWHPVVGPAQRRVQPQAEKPLQYRHLSGLLPRWADFIQVPPPHAFLQPPAPLAFWPNYETSWHTLSFKIQERLSTHFYTQSNIWRLKPFFFLDSSGRDKVCTVWDLVKRRPKRVIPVYEVSSIAVQPII